MNCLWDNKHLSQLHLLKKKKKELLRKYLTYLFIKRIKSIIDQSKSVRQTLIRLVMTQVRQEKSESDEAKNIPAQSLNVT